MPHPAVSGRDTSARAARQRTQGVGLDGMASHQNRRLARRPWLAVCGSVAFGHPLDPVVGGSLEDASCGLISWCIEHVQLASDNLAVAKTK